MNWWYLAIIAAVTLTFTIAGMIKDLVTGSICLGAGGILAVPCILIMRNAYLEIIYHNGTLHFRTKIAKKAEVYEFQRAILRQKDMLVHPERAAAQVTPMENPPQQTQYAQPYNNAQQNYDQQNYDQQNYNLQNNGWQQY